MPDRTPFLPTAMSIAVITLLSACGAGQPIAVEKLDELTAVTITHSRTPLILSPDTPFEEDVAKDFVQIGPIEVNRMGTLQYFLWLGILDIDYMESQDEESQDEESQGEHPQGYESIVLSFDGEESPLEIHGWTENSIGVSEPVYKKIFSSATDAYYPATLEQIGRLAEAEAIQLRTSDSEPKEFVLLYKQTTARNDLAEFLRTVLE
jgi:hypothetical protein